MRENGENREPSSEEDDLLRRSSKKTKHQERNENDMETERAPLPVTQSQRGGEGLRREGYSYMNATGGFQPQSAQQVQLGKMQHIVEEDLTDDEQGDMREMEEPYCPVIQLSKEEKATLRKPWLNTLIIKLFDRKMRYEDLIRNC